MYLNPDLKIVYLAHPRTASHSTSRVLQNELDFLYVGKPGKNGAATYGFVLPGKGGHHARMICDPPEGWMTLTTVRNHYDLFCSWWHYQPRGRPFNEAYIMGQIGVTSAYFPERRQAFGLHRPYATHLLRFETLSADLNDALAERGVGPVELPHVHKSLKRDGAHYSKFYDGPTRDFVRLWFKDEMAELGYEWEDAGVKEPAVSA